MKTLPINKMLVAIVVCAAISATDIAKGTLLSNGGFEADPAGTTVTNLGGAANVIDSTTITDWRAFAVLPAEATFTVETAAAHTGTVGIQIARHVGGGDSALDRDAHRVNIPAEERIYKQLVDVRDGGTYGGSGSFALTTQFFSGGVFSGNQRGHGIDPQADWETTGMTARSNPADDQLAVRYNVNSSESVYLDNVEVIDATYGVNRMINGGFENSDTRLLDWRFFAVAGDVGSIALDGDAASGSHAARMERTVAEGDSGLDMEPLRIATLGGETLQVGFASKKISGTSDAQIRLSVAMFNSSGGHLGDLANLYNPGTSAYENFFTDYTLTADTAFVNVGFRIFDTTGASSTGAYLIDDVSVVGIPEPASIALLLICGFSLTMIRRRLT